MKKFTTMCAAILIVLFTAGLFASLDDLLVEYSRVKKTGDHAKALTIIEKAIEEHGESDKLFQYKYETLEQLGKYPEALIAAIKRADLSKRKSPWHCLAIVSICIKLNDLDKAFAWLDTAIDRGFLSYTELNDDQYKPLHNDKRYAAAIQRVKDNIGIDKPAKDFTVTLMDGSAYTLSKQKGKVILIDFWATWCPPCREGLPHLKEFYAEFKDKGFDILGISLDSNPEDLQTFLKNTPLPWKLLFTNNGWSDPTARLYNVNLIPSYWLIDRAGTLRHFGLPLRDKPTLKKAIESLIAE